MTTSNRHVILSSDIIILAVKPAQVEEVMDEIQTVFKEFPSPSAMANSPISPPKNFRPVIVSVAAAVQIKDLEQKVVCVTPPPPSIASYPGAGGRRKVPGIHCLRMRVIIEEII